MIDGRGSEPQRYLYRVMKEVYPQYTLVYEQDIPSLGQRFDIFVKELGIAIEYDGVQHNQFVEHFHKNMEGYVDARKRDTVKEKFAYESGIKVVRLDGDIYHHDKNSLSVVIDAVEYPDAEYDPSCVTRPISRKLEREREFRQKRYNRFKESKEI